MDDLEQIVLLVSPLGVGYKRKIAVDSVPHTVNCRALYFSD